MARRIWLIAALTLLAAACGDDDDAAARTTIASSTTPTTSIAPMTTPVATTTQPPASTVVATTLAHVTAPTASCAEPPAFDSATPLRDQFVSYLVGCGFTQLEGACLFDHLDFDDPAVLAGDTDAMSPAFQACDIDASRMAEIGGA